ncbi:MAG: cation-translocating P-type ATPase [Acidimicrobiia bacterium]
MDGGSIAPEQTAWHALSIGVVRSRLSVPDASGGLDEEEAVRRLGTYGPNEITRVERPGRIRLFLRQFTDILIWVLIAAALVSGIVLGDRLDAVVIFAIVILNAVIGFAQEARAEAALAALDELSAPEARVLRGGLERRVAAADVVPGDELVLSAGDRIPADARVVQAVRLTLDESTLTGESMPVEKQVDAVDARAGVADRRSLLYAGTVVVAGRGRALVVATGPDTEMGHIADMLSSEEPPTPLQVELGRVGRRIAMLAGLAAAVVFVLGLGRDIPLERLFLVAVALAVAAIPEGLPAVTTITLSRGVGAMARRRAIIRRLPAVETLGAATVVCTDKTGTLTRNHMTVQWMALGGRAGPVEEFIGSPDLSAHARVSVLCSDVSISDSGLAGEPTEVALVEAVHPAVLDGVELRRALPRIDEAGFDSARKRMSTLHRGADGLLLAMKGAPEVVVERCERVLVDGVEQVLDAAGRDQVLGRADEFAARGLRTLATAYRRLDGHPAHPQDAEHGLVLAGVAGMSDEARPEAGPAVARSLRAGIRVVMVTGDHRVTAASIAERLGITGKVMDGARLRELSVDDLAGEVEAYGVYARVDPADKVKIVEAWKHHDAIVAMTGDGVNDAPALHVADIGVAMGSGTDVAKEAADMVLADDNFATIVSAVEEGRGIFGNIKKVVYFLLAANISEVITMLAGFLAFGAFGEPLLAAQLLWINLVTDGLPALALGMDPVPADVMRRPPARDRNLLGVPHQVRLGWQGALLATGPISMFVYGSLVRELPWEDVRTLAFTCLVLIQLVFAFAVRAQTRSMFSGGIGGNHVLVLAVLGSVALQLLVVYTPLGWAWFGTAPIVPGDWVALTLACLLPVAVIDAVKTHLRSRHPERETAFD